MARKIGIFRPCKLNPRGLSPNPTGERVMTDGEGIMTHLSPSIGGLHAVSPPAATLEFPSALWTLALCSMVPRTSCLLLDLGDSFQFQFILIYKLLWFHTERGLILICKVCHG